MSFARCTLFALAGFAATVQAGDAVAPDALLPFNGGPLQGIVVPPDASPAERFAASECRAYLRRATGATVEIVEAAKPPQGKAILVGRRFLATPPAAFSRTDRFGPDPYVVEITDQRVYLAGRGDRGTVYAVYDFLENDVGCRWLQPSDDGDFVPRLAEIRLKAGRREETPAFVFRIAGGFRSEAYVDWATKHRLHVITQETEFPERGGSIVGTMGHAFYQFVPPEEYFEEHPEYFEMTDGGRRKSERGQLCTTNPEVVEIVARKVREYFAEHPTASYVSLSPNDYWTWCRCPNCRKYDTGEVFRKATTRDKFAELRVVSDGLWQFLDAVAERVEPDFPDKKLYCFAYNQYIYPPRNLAAHPMVMPSICHMSPANYARPIDDPDDPENTRFREIVRRWRETDIELFYYAYTWKTMWEQNPWPIARRLARDIRYLSKNHFIGFYSQGGEGAWGQLGVNFYVMAKALWDPNCDVEAILDDYFLHAFGPAHEPMKRYFDAIERAFTAKGNFVHHVAPVETRQILKPEVLAACDAAIRDACARAPDEVVRKRIELVDRPYRYAKHFRAAHDAHAEWSQTRDPADLRRAVAEMSAAISLCEENVPPDALSPRLTARVKDRYLKKWQTELSRAR